MIPGRGKGRRNLAPLPSPLPYFYAVDEDAQLTYHEAEVFMEGELARSNQRLVVAKRRAEWYWTCTNCGTNNDIAAPLDSLTVVCFKCEHTCMVADVEP